MESTEISPSAASRLKRIARENPALPIGNLNQIFEKSIKCSHKKSISLSGIAAFTAIVAHGIFNFNKRGIRPSLFIINYRLAAQGTLIGCVTLGLLCNIVNEQWKGYKRRKEACKEE